MAKSPDPKPATKPATKTAGKPPAKSADGKAPVRSRSQKSPAEWAYDRLVLYIRNFERQLDKDQEVAIGFAGSDAGILQIEGVGFYEPDIITFYGRDEEGMKTQLIQHVAQLNVLLRAVPKASEDEAPRRIGFRLASGWDGGESGDGSA